MKKPYLIGCASQFNNGKDTLCDYLAYKLNQKCIDKVGHDCWTRASFASNVKRVFADTFEVSYQFIEEWKRKEECPPGFDMPVRPALCFIGDGFRSIKANIWIDLLLKDNKRNLIVSDCRYYNEFETIRKNNGITILLWRPGHENTMENKSEQEVMQFVDRLRNRPDGEVKQPDIPFDLWIRNDGDLASLYAKADEIIVPYVDRVLKCT